MAEQADQMGLTDKWLAEIRKHHIVTYRTELKARAHCAGGCPWSTVRGTESEAREAWAQHLADNIKRVLHEHFAERWGL